MKILLIAFLVLVSVAQAAELTTNTCDTGDCKEIYQTGERVIKIAEPEEGWYFVGWLGYPCYGIKDCSFVITKDLAIEAVFEEIPKFNIHVLAQEGGTVTSSPAGLNCEGRCETAFPMGAKVVLTATAKDGYYFVGWRGVCTGTLPCTVAMTKSKAINALFKKVR